MPIVYTTLILLLAVALSGVLLRMLPMKLPLPLVQIAVGAVLGLPLFGLHVRFDPELFFVLFIPPLLFADGWRMPRREFFAMRGQILALALGLVFFTVLGIGYFVHWMIPAVPLVVAFALASVLSPTDAVAVGSITGGNRLPLPLMHILQGEALMNDASGLVALQFAVTAALTGVFSLGDATLRFLMVAFGGLASGFVVTWLFGQVRRGIARFSGEIDAPSHIALMLLLPFAAYLLAERLGVSGILAAVAAGMTMNGRMLRKGAAPAVATRMQSGSVWGMVEFIFNGIIFLLLGLQLPAVLSHAREDMHQAGGGPLWYLPLYVLAITLALILLRFAWVWISVRFIYLAARLRGRQRQVVGTRLLWVTALAGVRGAITLAGILSLPFAVADGAAFPARGLMIFLAAGVILCTLLVGAVGLPLLLRGLRLPGEDPHAREERVAREHLARSAIAAIQAHMDAHGNPAADASDQVARVGSRVLEEYAKQLQAADESDGEQRQQARNDVAFERELRSRALAAERDTLLRLRREHTINDHVQHVLRRELDLAEVALGSRANGTD